MALKPIEKNEAETAARKNYQMIIKFILSKNTYTPHDFFRFHVSILEPLNK